MMGVKSGKLSINKHEGSAMHTAAIYVIITIPKSCSDVGVMLSSEHALQKRIIRNTFCRFEKKYFSKIFIMGMAN